MGTHTRRTFLNSCVKTPIDPCNNCPAPMYNRPKVYLGRLAAVNSLSKVKENNITTNSLYWPSTNIRSLAKFYESIPDYCDINHLNEEEFYTTLDSLRSTCQELKTKPVLLEESSNSSPHSLIATCTKPKKGSKKKTGSTKKSTKKKSKSDKKTAQDNEDLNCFTNINTPYCGFLEVPQITRLSSLNCKEDFREEVDAFKKTLKDYEDELKKRAMSRCLGRARSSSFLAKLDTPTIKVDENTQTEAVCLTPKPTTRSCSKTSMRKSFSSNDIDSISDIDKKNVEPEKIIGLKPDFGFTKVERSTFKDKTRLNDYFFEKPAKNLSATVSELPKITVQSPTSEITTSNTTTERTPISHFKKEKQSKKKKTQQTKDSFGIFSFGSNSSKKENIETPSPVHPVARPNLAATLRAEVSKKKLKELQNNCTYHDSTPQFDWEVRKTPAWRLLSLNESHKEILALRLATRKAEQAMQEREYELNMELMRQRVKSAPLLLEGSTFWGPSVGKLTHNCQNEGTRHACDSLKRKQRKKSAAEQDQHHQHQHHFHSRNKLNEIQKIYGCTGKMSSQSRSSQRSAVSTQRRRKEKKHRSAAQPTEGLLRPPTLLESSRLGGNESGDDLCSVDRAFL